MGWLGEFMQAINSGRQRDMDAMRQNIMLRDLMMREDQALRERDAFPLEQQRRQLGIDELSSALEDARRERADKAAAGASAQSVLDAYMPKAATIDRSGALDLNENPEAASIEAPTTPGRPAARTVPELFTRGATPEDYERTSKYRPNLLTGLGLMTPEAAEKATLANKSATRLNDIQDQIATAIQAGDTRKARTLNAVLAAAKGDSKDLMTILSAMEPQPEEGDTIDLDRGVKLIRARDPNGLVRTRTVPLTEGDQVAARTARMVGLMRKKDAGTPLTADEAQQFKDDYRFINTMRPSQLQPGGYAVPRGPMDLPGPSPTGQPAQPSASGAAAPQGAYRGVPPVMQEGEAEKVGLRNSIITELEDAASIGENLAQLKDWTGRGSLRVRSFIQGHTPFETLSPEEQRWVTMHDRLRIMYEASTMGLGPFRSPEMQRQMAEIIGKYWTPGTATRLRTLADNIRVQGLETEKAQAAGGRRSAPTPPRPTTMPPGGGVPAPTVRWGRDAQGNPVRLQ